MRLMKSYGWWNCKIWDGKKKKIESKKVKLRWHELKVHTGWKTWYIRRIKSEGWRNFGSTDKSYKGCDRLRWDGFKVKSRQTSLSVTKQIET